MKRYYKYGIYGDGSYGHQHVRERLAALVEEYDGELAEELRGDMTDDGAEEDEALDVMNENTLSHHGPVTWEFIDGDLMLSRLISENMKEK